MITRTIFVSALALLWCVPLGAADTQRDREEREEARQESLIEARSWMVYQRGHLFIEGTVVDEDGKPIPEFVVEYPHARNEKDLAKLDKAVMKGGILGTGDVEREIGDIPGKVSGKNGRFQIDAKYIDLFTDLWFTFRATGYYNREVSMHFPLSDEESAALDQAVSNSVAAKEWTPPKEVPIKKKFNKIVMRKKASKPTTLKRWNVILDVMRNKDQIGFEFPLPKEKKEPGRVRASAKGKRLPAQSIFLSVKHEPEGGFQIVQAPEPVWGRPADVPVSAAVVMNAAPGDGFIRYECPREDTEDQDVHYHGEPIFRSMKMAPEKGYALELPLSSDDLLHMTHDNMGMTFFFKCGGRYGRARCTGFAIDKDRSALGISLTVELQPDGSRNLETGE